MVTSASSCATNQAVGLTSPLDVITSTGSTTGHARLDRAASSSTFTVGGKDRIKVTLTSATPDVEKWKSYDDLLTEYRKKIEASEAQEKEKERQKQLEVCLMSPGATGGVDGTSLQLPQHWSHQGTHESLRHTHSDPPSMHYQDTSSLGGHLALAKTLSDEGAHPDDHKPQTQQQQTHQSVSSQSRSMMPNVMPQQNRIRQKSPKGRKVSPHSQPDMPGNQHRKLQRQLSLKGDEDPRVQQHIYKDAGNTGPMQPTPVQFPHPQLQKRQSAPPSNKPSFRFHGHEGPHNPHIRIAGQPTWSFGGDPAIPPGWQQEVSPSRGSKMKKEKAPLTRHASFGPHPLMHPAHRQHQQAQPHTPLGRMSSAPGTYFTKSQDQETERLAIPRMTRQNSTSDPQLHAHLMEEQMCMAIPFESYATPADQDNISSVDRRAPWSQGTVGGSGSLDEVHSQIQDVYARQRQGIPPNLNFNVPPPPVSANSPSGFNELSRRPSGQLDPNQDRLTPPNVPFGQQGSVAQQFVQFGSTKMKIPIDDAPAIFDPSVPPPNHPVLNHPPPLPLHTPPRNNSPVRQDASPLTMSPVHQTLRQQRSGNEQYRLSPPPPPIQPPSSSDQHNFNMSNFPYGQLPMASPLSSSSSFSPRSSEFGSREQLAAIGSGRKMTPPHAVQESLISDIISPDTRASIYYHLSGLFPEDKVQAVMEAFPNETDPKVLCAHIIKMN